MLCIFFFAVLFWQHSVDTYRFCGLVIPPSYRCPACLRTPYPLAPTRKVNPYAKDSISAAGPSGLKAAAHKAFDRVAKPPSTPEVISPAGNSTTQDAFAKFRAMVRN